jgi:parallel beta-helix repeat protein
MKLGTGIEIRGGAHDLLIANNSLPDELGYGIAVAGLGFAANNLPNGADSPNIVISGNIITDAWDPGVVVSGASRVTVRDNSAMRSSTITVMQRSIPTIDRLASR